MIGCCTKVRRCLGRCCLHMLHWDPPNVRSGQPVRGAGQLTSKDLREAVIELFPDALIAAVSHKNLDIFIGTELTRTKVRRPCILCPPRQHLTGVRGCAGNWACAFAGHAGRAVCGQEGAAGPASGPGSQFEGLEDGFWLGLWIRRRVETTPERPQGKTCMCRSGSASRTLRWLTRA